MLPRSAGALWLLMILAAGCSKSSPSAPTPSPSPTPQPSICTFTVSDGPSAAVVHGGAEFTISIVTTAACSWSATSAAPYITIVGSSSGTGSGDVRFSVQPNTGGARQSTVQVAGRTIAISQAAAPGASSCEFTVSPTQIAMTAPGGTVSVNVGITSGTDCSWTAVSSDSFIVVTQGASGSGPGSVQLAIAQNSGSARTGSATVAGVTVSVLQEAGQPPPIPCDYTVSPLAITAPASGSSTIVTVTVTQGFGCAWIAQTQSSFITLPGNASGTGSGSFTVTVAQNTGAARSGTISVAGRVVTVNQPAGVSGPPVAILSFQSDPGDYVGAGMSKSYQLQQSEFQLTSSDGPGHISFRMVSSPFWSLDLLSSGQRIFPGLYPHAQRYPFQDYPQPGLSFSGDGRGCNNLSGRFLVNEAVYAADGSLRRLQARFEQHCEWFSPALRGEIWIDMDGALPSGPAPPFPPNNGETSYLTYQSEPGDPIGQGGSETLTIATAKFQAGVMTSRPTVNIWVQALPGASFFQRHLDFQAPSGAQLLPGTYDNVGAYPFQPAGVPGLSFSTNLVCSTVTGRFVVHEVLYGSKGEVYRFHATFEQRCNGSTATLRGEVKIFSDPWR